MPPPSGCTGSTSSRSSRRCAPPTCASSSTSASAAACAAPEYAWANAQRLQAALADAGIEYRHHKELAPTTELRQVQYREDARRGEGKRSRSVLAPEYARRYTREILDPVDLTAIVDELPDGGVGALLCVERDPEACHRSLIADRLATEHGVAVQHLRP